MTPQPLNGRYEARATDPPQVFDTLKGRVSTTHLDFEGAVSLAYILNRFSTGARI
jgi:hypothetical protein